MFRGHATPERTPTRSKLIFRSANGNSAALKTRLIPESLNLGFSSQKLEFGNQNLGNPKFSENSCKLPSLLHPHLQRGIATIGGAVDCKGQQVSPAAARPAGGTFVIDTAYSTARGRGRRTGSACRMVVAFAAGFCRVPRHSAGRPFRAAQDSVAGLPASVLARANARRGGIHLHV